jgi:hypothetical protein
MSCLHCAATYQRGRFCNRCGKRIPPGARADWRMPLIRRRAGQEDDHQLPGRPVQDRVPAAPGGGRSRAAEAQAGPAEGTQPSTGPSATLRRRYDTALERDAGHSRPSLQRYVSVLIAAR